MLEHQLQALADPTRQKILKLTADEPLTAGDVAARFRMTRPAVSQHLKVLRDSGLIRVRAEGTKRLYTTNRNVLMSLFKELDDYWSLGLMRLKAAAEMQARDGKIATPRGRRAR